MSKLRINHRVKLVVLAFVFIAVFLTGTFYVNIHAIAEAEVKSVKVHYIDVGQADSILIQSSTANMLIDAGNRDDDKTIIKYLKQQGVKKLDYLIGTHPHEDHIGGMASVIKAFKVTNIIMPKVTTNTKTFEYLLQTIKSKGLKITTPVVGKTFTVGGAKCTILAPNDSNYEDLNNYSIVIKMVYGKTSFLFQGDAENLSEQQILNQGNDVKADVLKLGHHGSNSSTSTAYLGKVNPKYAIISCGKDNDYGHPHKEIIKRLVDRKIKYYRTDLGGTVVCTSDGKNIKFVSGKVLTTNTVSTNTTSTKTSSVTNDSNSNAQSSNYNVYITKTGVKYHLENCRTLKSTKIKISLKDAKNKGYQPCGICKP